MIDSLKDRLMATIKIVWGKNIVLTAIKTIQCNGVHDKHFPGCVDIYTPLFLGV
jgi:hypothetical protein